MVDILVGVVVLSGGDVVSVRILLCIVLGRPTVCNELALACILYSRVGWMVSR